MRGLYNKPGPIVIGALPPLDMYMMLGYHTYMYILLMRS